MNIKGDYQYSIISENLSPDALNSFREMLYENLVILKDCLAFWPTNNFSVLDYPLILLTKS